MRRIRQARNNAIAPSVLRANDVTLCDARCIGREISATFQKKPAHYTKAENKQTAVDHISTDAERRMYFHFAGSFGVIANKKHSHLSLCRGRRRRLRWNPRQGGQFLRDPE